MKWYEHFNKSHLVHSLMGLGIQWGLTLTPWFDPISGAIAATLWFLAFEISQHEFRAGGPKMVPWYYGLINHWKPDSILDILSPVAVMAASAYAYYNYFV